MPSIARWLFFLLASGMILWQVLAPPREQELVISAAASLTDVLIPLEKLARASGQLPPFRLNLAGSGALRFQIQQGAPVDVFLAANRHEPALLRAEGRVEPPIVFARGQLVLVVARSSSLSSTSAEDLTQASLQRLAMGSPETVPAGRYARQALEKLQLWEPLKSRLVFAEHVRQVVHYVESGAVDAGIVYQTDAQARQKLRIAWPFPAQTHEPIEYTAAVTLNSASPEQARRFVDFLLSPPAQALLAQSGFRPPQSSTTTPERD